MHGRNPRGWVSVLHLSGLLCDNRPLAVFWKQTARVRLWFSSVWLSYAVIGIVPCLPVTQQGVLFRPSELMCCSLAPVLAVMTG